MQSSGMIGPYGIALSQPPYPVCDHGPVSTLSLGFQPATLRPHDA